MQQHLKLGAAGGFVTGLGGFITLPIALPLNILEFYVVATRMVAAIASVRGYDIRQPEIRSAVLLTLVGADSDDLLKKAGVATTGRLSNLAAQRLPGPALMVVNKAVAFRLLNQLGKKSLTRLGKGVPLVGGAVGAGLDVYLLKRIADYARHEFPRATRRTEASAPRSAGGRCWLRRQVRPDCLGAVAWSERRRQQRGAGMLCAAWSLAPCPVAVPGDGREPWPNHAGGCCEPSPSHSALPPVPGPPGWGGCAPCRDWCEPRSAGSTTARPPVGSS